MASRSGKECSLIPNILILSDEGPQTGSAGGLLLYRLLQDHPAEKLHILARHVPAVGTPLPGVTYQKLLIPWHRFESSRFHRLKRSLRAWGPVPPASLKKIRTMLGSFHPDIVLCVMQHAQYYDTAFRFARESNLPLVVLVHDINREFEVVYPWAHRAATEKDGLFYRSATARLCISPEMEKFCSETYGAPGEVLYPNRDESLQPRAPDISRTLRTPGRLTIGFAGNLGYGYGDAVLQLLPALRSAGARLVIYGRLPDAAFLAALPDSETCEFRGFVPSHEAWAGIKKDCDAVWLPYPNPAGAMETLYRYHFPSKLPEYLALGMPVIISGPGYATGVRWALQNPEACVAFTGNPDAFVSVLSDLAQDPSRRFSLAEKALDSGNRDFNPVQIKKHFYDVLQASLQS